MNPKFITFEGGEGAGKTTQINLLKEFLEKKGFDVVQTREPGGSEGAELIRRLLVCGAADRWSANSELLLMYAARADHCERLIKPSLQTNKWVLCDRFADSSMAYQGYGRGIHVAFLNILYEFVVKDLRPHKTFILDIDPLVGLKRSQNRLQATSKDQIEGRFESLDLGFHQRVRAGFLEIATKDPDRCVVLDASCEISKIHVEVIKNLGF